MDDSQTLGRLLEKLAARATDDDRHYEYLTLQRKIEHLGMAIPPEMRQFLVVANWPRTVVNTILSRQQVRSITVDGIDGDAFQSYYDANNLAAQLKTFRRDLYTFGRAFISVGSNERNPDLPLIRVESPREIEVEVDVRTRSLTRAARFYGVDDNGQGPTHATLYEPNSTRWFEQDSGRWKLVDEDTHNLGAVPIIMHLNEQWSGSFEGESELTDIIPLTDSAARSLTNLQFAQEAHGVPGLWATGVKKGDFVDSNGQPLRQFEAYYDVIKMLSDPSAKWGQFNAADLKNFETALESYGKQASIVTGFPARYFGLTTTNPATEGAIIADEIQLVRRVEDKNESEGVVLGWMIDLAHRIASGSWIEGNLVRVEYVDPATPTIAQREDALSKRRAAGVLSLEGYWDELGWSKPRQDRERARLEQEAELQAQFFLGGVKPDVESEPAEVG